MALLSGRGEAVGRRGDCGWLSRDWSMALLSGTGDAVARGECLGEVSPCAGKIDGTGRMFCVGAVDTGVACVINHSES